MSSPLTPTQISTIKSTIPLLRVHLPQITTLFYRNLLSSHPALHNYFNRLDQTLGSQPRALASAVLAYAVHIENPSALSPVIERIARKHVSLTVAPEHYPIVGEYLVQAFGQVLGPLGYMTEDVKQAWTAAYGLLAGVFIGREKELYSQHKEEEEGWEGWKGLKIVRKEKETKDGGIVSFYLENAEDGDKKKLPSFKPGQYISVRVPVEGEEKDEWKGKYMQPRQYSLSDRPGTGWYRITVKREVGGKKIAGSEENQVTERGLVSNILHESYQVGDVLEITHPTGDFYLVDGEEGKKERKEKGNDNNIIATKTNTNGSKHNTTPPLVLISAGVGVTPLMSILNSVVSSDSSRPISWIQGAHTPSERAFSTWVRDVCQEHKDHVKAALFSTKASVSGTGGEGVCYDNQQHFEGRVDLDKTRDLLQLDFDTKGAEKAEKAHYYVCGPRGFMADVQNYLVANGVTADRIHMEIFGVGGLEEAGEGDGEA